MNEAPFQHNRAAPAGRCETTKELRRERRSTAAAQQNRGGSPSRMAKNSSTGAHHAAGVKGRGSGIRKERFIVSPRETRSMVPLTRSSFKTLVAFTPCTLHLVPCTAAHSPTDNGPLTISSMLFALCAMPHPVHVASPAAPAQVAVAFPSMKEGFSAACQGTPGVVTVSGRTRRSGSAIQANAGTWTKEDNR